VCSHPQKGSGKKSGLEQMEAIEKMQLTAALGLPIIGRI